MHKSLPGLLVLFLIGCATAIDPGADPVVVNAERVTQQCVATLDTFLQYEFDHRSKLDLEVTKAADEIRLKAPSLIRSIRLLTRTYKATRLAEDRLTLEARVHQLEHLTQLASAHMEDQQ